MRKAITAIFINDVQTSAWMGYEEAGILRFDFTNKRGSRRFFVMPEKCVMLADESTLEQVIPNANWYIHIVDAAGAEPGDPAKGTQTIKGVGGAARRATVINRIRSETHTPLFLTDSGDLMYRRSYIGRSFHGEADIAVLNATGYDAMVPGNHDFEWSGSELLALIQKSRVPWVCANLA